MAKRFPPPPLSCNHCRAHPCIHQGGGGGYQHGNDDDDGGDQHGDDDGD